MNLNTRFFLLRLAVFAVFTLLAWFGLTEVSEQINEQWGRQFAERQVLFDKHRTLSPLIQEIRLARKMASEPALIKLALHENDAGVRDAAVKVMNQYRMNFRDHSYFVALANNGHYYFNDRDGQYSGREFRYTLSRQTANDQWFYATLKDGHEYQINLDPDIHLGVVKVWINVLLKQGDAVLGVIGTGIDLTDFIKESVGIEQSGVDNFFVDKSLAVQLSVDKKLIDYASIAKDVSQRIKIDRLLSPQDIERLKEVTKRLEASQGEGVETLWVDYRGSKHLMGVAYLPEVGWFDLTIMDPSNLALLHGLQQLLLKFVLAFLVALLVLGYFLHRWVLSPLAKLQAATLEVQRGNYEFTTPTMGQGEVASLARSFEMMVNYVQKNEQDLEQRIQDRTNDLQRLTEIDSLTGLLNRRGMTDRFQKEIARQARHSGSMGILLLDLDHFKNVNDRYGHAAGDLALCGAANVLLAMKRSYDHAARWGGEEFLVLLPDCSEEDLLAIAERIRDVIAYLQIEAEGQTFSFTVSIGAHRPTSPQTLDEMVMQVDRALYAAKDAGRNCVRMAENSNTIK